MVLPSVSKYSFGAYDASVAIVRVPADLIAAGTSDAGSAAAAELAAAGELAAAVADAAAGALEARRSMHPLLRLLEAAAGLLDALGGRRLLAAAAGEDERGCDGEHAGGMGLGSKAERRHGTSQVWPGGHGDTWPAGSAMVEPGITRRHAIMMAASFRQVNGSCISTHVGRRSVGRVQAVVVRDRSTPPIRWPGCGSARYGIRRRPTDGQSCRCERPLSTITTSGAFEASACGPTNCHGSSAVTRRASTRRATRSSSML